MRALLMFSIFTCSLLPAFADEALKATDGMLRNPRLSASPKKIERNEGETSLTLPVNSTGCFPPGIPYGSPKVIRDQTSKFFEPKCLSKPSTKVSLYIQLNADPKSPGFPSINLVSSNDADERDLFYCEQAVWEVSPFNQNLQSSKCEFDNQVTGNKSTELYSEDKAFVRIHLIPGAAIERYPAAITMSEIQSPQNSIKLSCLSLKSPRLNQFRTTWAQFFSLHEDQNLTKAELETQANLLKTKYSDLFSQ